ncbi:NAD(P)-dependent oxidoreductase [Mycobacterium seoulense]|uniref:NAD(P)-dependent oxidoreductase n=1 Tax=Mycobacterium seoulense TaxID=386911 RepID=UPI003CF20EF6
MSRVGFFGVGQMGAPMVSRLLDRGQHEVVLYARRPEVCEHHAARGAGLAGSLKELARASDVLILCLFSDLQLRETAFGEEGFLAHLPEGAIVVSHTTGSPALVADIAQTAPHVRVIDGPISGDSEDILQGRLTVLLGGEPDAVDTARDVVSAYADPIIATGALGSALLVKLLNNLLFAANSQLLADTAAAGAKLGLDEGSLLAALSACSGSSAALQRVRQVGGLAPFERRVTPYLRKDVATAIALAEEMGVSIDFVRGVAEKGPLSVT